MLPMDYQLAGLFYRSHKGDYSRGMRLDSDGVAGGRTAVSGRDGRRGPPNRTLIDRL
jgi:hypothetical protein